jgi:hypothetical protein
VVVRAGVLVGSVASRLPRPLDRLGSTVVTDDGPDGDRDTIDGP